MLHDLGLQVTILTECLVHLRHNTTDARLVQSTMLIVLKHHPISVSAWYVSEWIDCLKHLTHLVLFDFEYLNVQQIFNNFSPDVRR